MARASAGTARFPEHAADAESLFRAADPAMYSVKRSGKDRVALAGASALASWALARLETTSRPRRSLA
jgi:predicted signal transduction protein with EAL and GGDEF domain